MNPNNTGLVTTLIEEIQPELIRENQPLSECARVCYLTLYREVFSVLSFYE